MSFKSIAADNLADRFMTVFGKAGKELTRNELRAPISESTFRMLDDQLVKSGTVSAKELSAALQTTTDEVADKLNKVLTTSEATPFYKKWFGSDHQDSLLKALESFFKAKPTP